MTTTEEACREFVDIGGRDCVSTLGWAVLRATDRVCRDNTYQCTSGQNGMSFAPVIRVEGVNLTMLGDDEESIDTGRYYRTLILQGEPGTSRSSLQAAVTRFADQLQVAITTVRQEPVPDLRVRVCQSVDHHPRGHVTVTEDKEMGYWSCYRHGLLYEEDTQLIPRSPFQH
jgi:hypothetical protein